MLQRGSPNSLGCTFYDLNEHEAEGANTVKVTKVQGT